MIARDDHNGAFGVDPNCRHQLKLHSQFIFINHLFGRVAGLVHNHPSGDPSPSSADVSMTRTIADVAGPLGIVVHDHIIIGRDGHVSLKALRLF